MHAASTAAGRAQGIKAARTIASIVRQSGDSWWQSFGGLQLSPMRLVDGTPLLGAARIVLAASALAFGYLDRRWAAANEMARLGYGPYRDERPTIVPVEQNGTTRPEGNAYTALFNAEQVRATRGGGMRTGSPVPPEQPMACDRDETADAIARVALSLLRGRVLVARDPKRWDTRSASRLLEAAALESMRDHPQSTNGTATIESLALTADLAAAMALSDLGVPPSCARSDKPPTRAVTLRWAEVIQDDPQTLLDCAARADSLATRLSDAARVALATPSDEEGRTVSEPPTTIGTPSSPRSHDDDRPGNGSSPSVAHTSTDAYTLRSVAEESRLASIALASDRRMGR